MRAGLQCGRASLRAWPVRRRGHTRPQTRCSRAARQAHAPPARPPPPPPGSSAAAPPSVRAVRAGCTPHTGPSPRPGPRRTGRTPPATPLPSLTQKTRDGKTRKSKKQKHFRSKHTLFSLHDMTLHSYMCVCACLCVCVCVCNHVHEKGEGMNGKQERRKPRMKAVYLMLRMTRRAAAVLLSRRAASSWAVMYLRESGSTSTKVSAVFWARLVSRVAMSRT